MKLYEHIKQFLLALTIFSSPALALALDTFKPTTSASSSFQNNMPDSKGTDLAEDSATETFILAGVDFCYAGSITDPTTGEMVDLFVLCGEDGLEQNLDLA